MIRHYPSRPMKGPSTLADNHRVNMRQTLKCFGSFEEQLSYKAKVPFVHIPIELICQWIGGFRRVQDRPWFEEAFSMEVRKAMRGFDVLVLEVERKENLQDVPEIFTDPGWKKLQEPARQLTGMIQN